LPKISLAAAYPWGGVEEFVNLFIGPLSDGIFFLPFARSRQAEDGRECYEEKDKISAGNGSHNVGPEKIGAISYFQVGPGISPSLPQLGFVGSLAFLRGRLS
jgi:hypothetical protein